MLLRGLLFEGCSSGGHLSFLSSCVNILLSNLTVLNSLSKASFSPCSARGMCIQHEGPCHPAVGHASALSLSAASPPSHLFSFCFPWNLYFVTDAFNLFISLCSVLVELLNITFLCQLCWIDNVSIKVFHFNDHIFSDFLMVLFHFVCSYFIPVCFASGVLFLYEDVISCLITLRIIGIFTKKYFISLTVNSFPKHSFHRFP